MLRAGLVLLTGINRSVPGIRALQVQRLGVDSPRPLGLSLDGELDGTIPGQFEVVAGAVRVIVPAARDRPAEGRASDSGSNRS